MQIRERREKNSYLFNSGAYVLNCFSCVWLFHGLYVAHQPPLSMGFSRQEYWSALPCPPPGDLPNPEIEPTSLTSPALVDGFYVTSITWKAPFNTGSGRCVCVCVCVCVYIYKTFFNLKNWSGSSRYQNDTFAYVYSV